MRLFIYILVLLLFQACTDRFDRVNRWYVLKNGTSHKVKMEFYNFGVLYSDSISGPGVIYEGLSSNDAGGDISAYDALYADSIFLFSMILKARCTTTLKRSIS